MRRTGYAAGGPVTPSTQAFGSWQTSGVQSPGMAAGLSPTTLGAGANASIGGSDTGLGGGGNEGGGGYARGGPVRKRKRRRRIGYAGGGEVDPLLMSVSLDQRAKNPEHTEEDEEALSTRPAGAPEAPDEFGYAEGGEVETDDELIPPDDTQTDDEQIPQEEPDQQTDDEQIPQDAVQQGKPDQQTDDEQIPEEAVQQDEEGGQQGGGGGGGGQQDQGQGQQQQPKTGFQPADEGDNAALPANATPTGYSPAAAPDQSALKEVLDYTRKALGITQAAAATPKTGDKLLEQPPADQGTNIPVPVATPSATGSTPDQQAPVEQTTAAPQPTTPEQPAQGGITPQRPVASTQKEGTASGPGNKQAIQAYMSGDRAFTQQEMTQLLDRTNQTNPNLDQSGSIHKAFNDLVAKGDIDGASKFVQGLRPSYDSVRALVIAATAKGDFNTAMQLAGQMNNLIPNGQQIQFAQGNNGIVNAIITPEGGGQPVALQMTADQFAKYANSPLSLFDHTAEQGLAKNLSMAGAQERQQYNAPGDIPRGAPPGSRNVQIPDGRMLTVAPDPGSYERGQPTYNRGLVVSETPTGQRPSDITSPANTRVSQGQPANPYGTAAERANPRVGYSGTASDRFAAPYGQLGGGPAPPMDHTGTVPTGPPADDNAQLPANATPTGYQPQQPQWREDLKQKIGLSQYGPEGQPPAPVSGMDKENFDPFANVPKPPVTGYKPDAMQQFGQKYLGFPQATGPSLLSPVVNALTPAPANAAPAATAPAKAAAAPAATVPAAAAPAPAPVQRTTPISGYNPQAVEDAQERDRQAMAQRMFEQTGVKYDPNTGRPAVSAPAAGQQALGQQAPGQNLVQQMTTVMVNGVPHQVPKTDQNGNVVYGPAPVPPKPGTETAEQMMQRATTMAQQMGYRRQDQVARAAQTIYGQLMKEKGANYRADQSTQQKQFSTQVASDNAVLRAVYSHLDANQKILADNLHRQQMEYEKNPQYMKDKDGNTVVKPFPYTDAQKNLLDSADKVVRDNKIDLRNYTPGSGVIRPTAPQQQQQSAPQGAPQGAPQQAPQQQQAPQTKGGPITHYDEGTGITYTKDPKTGRWWKPKSTGQENLGRI